MRGRISRGAAFFWCCGDPVARQSGCKLSASTFRIVVWSTSRHHLLLRKQLVPSGEQCVDRHREAPASIALGDELKGHAAFGLVATQVAQIIQDDQIEAIGAPELRWQLQLAPCRLQPLHKLTRVGE